MNKVDLSGSSKEEVMANFTNFLKETGHGQIDDSKPGYLKKCRIQDTVDGNPGAATKMCYPYSQGGGQTMGVNGPRGGRSGMGTYGD